MVMLASGDYRLAADYFMGEARRAMLREILGSG
jgi:hypothetical protein